MANHITGPSSSESPYLIRTQPGVVTMSVLTVGDSVNNKPDGVTPYRMVGIPDGLGAFDNKDGTFTLLMNHELPGNGINRAHGTNGAFVSKWIISKDDLTVIHGEDLIQNVWVWGTNGYQAASLAQKRFSRLCSADLPPISAFYDAASGLGYNGHIYMNGEESGADGRAFAHLLDGHSYELRGLGRFSWENSVAHPNPGIKTVVVGVDDSGGGQVYVYVGTKTTSSHPIEAAGLINGVLNGIKVTGFTNEIAATGIPSGTAFTGFDLGDVKGLTGAQLDRASVTNGVTGFNRPEDGCWDPSHPRDFYFVTTASFEGNSRLWRLRFIDPTNPALGGTIDMLLNGTEGQRMMDNITMTDRGDILIQEDPGNQAHIAKIWRYNIGTGSLQMIAQHDLNRFMSGAAGFLTQDEESSGIIPMSHVLGEGWFLLDVQAHYRIAGELVEGGQLLGLHIPPGRRK